MAAIVLGEKKKKRKKKKEKRKRKEKERKKKKKDVIPALQSHKRTSKFFIVMECGVWWKEGDVHRR